MKDKKKPVEAATEPRAYRINHQPLKHNHSTPTLQCPQCGLKGSTDLFEAGWLERLIELSARHSGLGIEQDIPCMTYHELRMLFNRLKRMK